MYLTSERRITETANFRHLRGYRWPPNHGEERPNDGTRRLESARGGIDPDISIINLLPERVTDSDPAPGVQFRDAGGADEPGTFFYLVTGVTDCGETPLR